MDGGLAQGFLLMSTPLTAASVPAPRQGEFELIWEMLASKGWLVILPVPPGRGVVQQ